MTVMMVVVCEFYDVVGMKMMSMMRFHDVGGIDDLDNGKLNLECEAALESPSSGQDLNL